MRVSLGVLLVALLSACATSTGGGGTGGKEQVTAATVAWRAAYDSRDPARITAMYDSDAVLWGTTAKTVSPNPAAIAEYFKDAGKRPNARVAFGEQHIRVYGDVAINTGYYTFSDVRDGQTVLFQRALLWCSGIETESGSSSVTIHPVYRKETDMKLIKLLTWAMWSVAFPLTALPSLAADYPAPKEGSWVVRDFRFHTGEALPELRLHYTTVGAPTGEPVLILHGTTGSSTNMLSPAFAGELFGPGQPLDASRYYVILPDAIGTGKSSKPSDGLRASFPKYNYDDMVHAQYRLVTEHLGVRHLRLALGNSMGGMHVWMWAQKYPDVMDAAVPMASMPSEMSGRNWMTRRLIIDSIRNDPEWMNGNYTKQPRSLQFASVFFGIATNGGNQRLYKTAPTREKADQLLNQRLSAPFRGDANDHLYQWEASRDYNASGGLERIQAVLLVINSADDERNPPELGLLDREIKRVKNGRVLLIPASDDTAGHGTTAQARFWKQHLAELLQSAPRRGK